MVRVKVRVRVKVGVGVRVRVRVKVRVHRVDARARLLDGLGAELGGHAPRLGVRGRPWWRGIGGAGCALEYVHEDREYPVPDEVILVLGVSVEGQLLERGERLGLGLGLG